MTNIFEEFFSKDNKDNKVENKIDNVNEVPDTVNKYGDTRFKGRITKIAPEGYGFILCPEIPFTRIFFHWSSLKQDTKNFTELKMNMKVEFNAINFVDKNTGKNKGVRAIKVNVIEG